MSTYLYKPITVIDGIGPKIARRLKTISAVNVIDILRLSHEFLYNFLERKEGEKEIERWRSQASLLQVYGMTPLYSKILYESGMLNVEYLYFSTLVKIKEILTAASVKYKHFVMPADNEICDWIKDSAALHFTGSISGYVIDSKGKAVKNAEVTAGNKTSYTDNLGRFRAVRVPLGRKIKLKISHSSFYPLISEDAKPVFGNNTISMGVYKMRKLPKNKKYHPKSVNADEFKGERIPKPNDFEKRIVARKFNELRRGDIFMIHKFSQTKAEKEQMATLISLFREVKDSIYNIYTWKVPVKNIPNGAKRPDNLIYNGKEFKTVKMNEGKMSFILDSRKASVLAKKKLKGIKVKNPKDIDKTLKEWFKAYKLVIKGK